MCVCERTSAAVCCCCCCSLSSAGSPVSPADSRTERSCRLADRNPNRAGSCWRFLRTALFGKNLQTLFRLQDETQEAGIDASLLAASTSEERGKRGLTDGRWSLEYTWSPWIRKLFLNACLVMLNVSVLLAGGPRNWSASTAAPVCTEALSVLSPH